MQICKSANFALLCLLALTPLASADPLPAPRRTDWTFTGTPGGIPNRTTVCATFSPGAKASAINSAISACANGVIKLNAGTYTAASLGGSILLYKSGVTLRGAGANQTILQGSNIIGMGNGYNTALGTAITGGGAQGAKSFTVASTANLSAGTLIEVDREDDPALVAGPVQNKTRNITQMNVITAISGNTVTLRNPLFHNFSTGTPKVKYYYPMATRLSGVEDLKMDHGGFTGGYNFLIQFCESCWIKGVESAAATGYHFIMVATLNMELRDSFVHDGGAGPNNSGFNLYGNYLYGGNSSARIENNIFNKDFPAIELNGSSSGLYIGYNYSHGTPPQGGADLVTWTYDDGHAPFNIMNLYEGNIGEMWGADGYFGGSGLGVVNRNYLTGYNPNSGARGDAIQIKRLGYSYSFIGNVLGSANQKPTAYDSGCGVINIFQLGYPNIGNCDTTPFDGFTPTGGYPDPKVKSTLLRWGNYDYFNKATRFVAAEIPAGVAVPADQLIPTSYVYTAKPAWWPSGVAWPPIGPDVVGGAGDASGHVHKIPAQICWENSNLLNGGAFNPATCYVAAAPTGLPVITSAPTSSTTVNAPYSYAITATNNPTSFGATGLPAGLSVNTSTGIISGAPTSVGNFGVQLSATNSKGTGSGSLSLTVNAAAAAAPVVTSALSRTAVARQAFNYAITATNTPTSFGAVGLPAGLSVNTNTGVISGTPTTAGNYTVALRASNANGTGSATLNLYVNALSGPPGVARPLNQLKFGTKTIGDILDSNTLGNAEAFQVSAAESGSVNYLTVYLDSSSTVTRMVVGLYTDSSGRPGALIGQGVTTSARAGAWNDIGVPTMAVTAGITYWIAVLGTNSGSIRFRDSSGGCKAQTSQQTNLVNLPAAWTAGQTWDSCPLSAYGWSNI